MIFDYIEATLAERERSVAQHLLKREAEALKKEGHEEARSSRIAIASAYGLRLTAFATLRTFVGEIITC